MHMHPRSRRAALLGALSLSLALVASHASAAPTEDQDDSLVPEQQFAPAQISAEAKTIGGALQPQLVAIHEIVFSYNPAPGLAQRTIQLRPRVQNKSIGGLAEMTTHTIVSTVPKPPMHDRYAHTATSDPYVDAHS